MAKVYHIGEEQLEELTSCPICLLKANKPYILPCQHYFCKEPCLDDWIAGENKPRCPICRKEFKKEDVRPLE